ncbi:MAG: DUF1292 domain-containing protein [Thomasclavelia sp.]|nr:DUF1292 domain-containing protein [Thomasclavelia sp.]
MEDNKIKVINEKNEEKIFEILFTFNNEDNTKQYVLYFDPELDEPEVYASIYNESGDLDPIESKEEWDLVEEVFNSFMQNADNEEDMN